MSTLYLSWRLSQLDLSWLIILALALFLIRYDQISGISFGCLLWWLYACYILVVSWFGYHFWYLLVTSLFLAFSASFWLYQLLAFLVIFTGMHYLVTSSINFGFDIWNSFLSCCWCFLIISHVFDDFALDCVLLWWSYLDLVKLSLRVSIDKWSVLDFGLSRIPNRFNCLVTLLRSMLCKVNHNISFVVLCDVIFVIMGLWV